MKLHRQLSFVFMFFFVFFFSSSFAHASLLAVIDSGTDILHEGISPYVWVNPFDAKDGKDEDQNGHIDDLHGWNFADDNNQLMNENLKGYFGPDVFKFFKLHGKMLRGEASSAEILWLKEKLAGKRFKKDINLFANFVHGTHVTGISQYATDFLKLKIMGIKIIPTPNPSPDGDSEEDEEEDQSRFDPIRRYARRLSTSQKQKFYTQFLSKLAVDQMELLKKVAKYIDNHKVNVANGSFGTGYNQVEGLVSPLYKAVFGKKPSESQLKKEVLKFLQDILVQGKIAMQMAPRTLFVFAAGNDSMDNDLFFTSPANIDEENVISVAATSGREELAKFSNFGKVTVDLAAPGVLIDSFIPGGGKIPLSGTSQAAPLVSGVAVWLKEINPALTVKEIKEIILKTVDVKAFLKGKVVTGGILNEERAIWAAQQSHAYSLGDAILHAKSEVSDVKSLPLEFLKGGVQDLELLEYSAPLPSPLKI